jgi:hypothetical protein
MSPVSEFIVYCIEEYKYEKCKSGRETIRLFNAFDVIAYIRRHYGALHSTSPDYIVNDITSYIAQRSA